MLNFSSDEKKIKLIRTVDEMFLRQVEVSGDITTLLLTGLISQTEYDVAVTPVYDEGPAAPMLGSAITGLLSFWQKSDLFSSF